MKNILVFGSINMDLVIHSPSIPAMGETITGTDFFTVPGGKGANQAIACGKLGGNVKMIGCVGNDIYGDMCLKNLSDHNVDVSDIEKVNANTGVAVVTIYDGDNCIILEPGANKSVTTDMINKHIDAIKWADIVIMQLEIPMDTVVLVGKYAKKFGAKVILNPAPMITLNNSCLKYVDVLIPNQLEASMILNKQIRTIDQAKQAVQEILQMGVGTVIITLGKNGCVYSYNNEIIHRKANKVDVVDTTAAGDSFIGGLSVAICKGKEWPSSIDFATAVSSITITRNGASVSIPTMEEVDCFLMNDKITYNR